MSMIVERPELRRFLTAGGRRLLYGRRKTGKTFYAQHVLKNYSYFIVRKGGTIYDPVEDQELDLKSFLRVCRSEEGVILDEFHRAHPKLFDAFQAGAGKNMVLITSTLHYFRKLVEGPEAPLKGLFAVSKADLLSPLDLLSTHWKARGKELIELLTLYQEPALIGRDLLECVLWGSEFARSLTGEILDEEDHTYTRRFDTILGALAGGRTGLTEMASFLHSHGLLESPSTSHLTKYVDAMIKTGLIERVEVWGRRRGSVYRHVSPLTELIYYLDTKYGWRDLSLSRGFVERVLRERLPLLVERFVERFMAEYFGMRPVRVLEPELDVALAEFKRLRVTAEVKWRNGLSAGEVKEIEAKLGRFPQPRRILVVPDKGVVPKTELEVWDVQDLTRKSREKRNEASDYTKVHRVKGN